MKERQLAQMVEQQINLSVVGSSPTLFLFYFLEDHLVSERRYFMLTKKEKKALANEKEKPAQEDTTNKEE